MIDNKITIKDDEMVNVQRGAIGHRATWTGLTYTKAREAGMEEAAEKIIRQAITETGLIQGGEIKAKCPNPDSVSSFADTFLTPKYEEYAKTFERIFSGDWREEEQTDDRLDIEFHHCPLLKAWQDLGFDDATCAKLCDMAMDGDRNIAKAMGYGFHLGDTIAEGCPTCKITFFKEKKED